MKAKSFLIFDPAYGYLDDFDGKMLPLRATRNRLLPRGGYRRIKSSRA